jgi:carboxylate-amine ligase
VLIAALATALVETEARRWRQGIPAQRRRAEPLRLAAWRASRSGINDVLISPVTGLPEQAAAIANLLLDHVRDALDEAGGTDTVRELLAAVLARGNGAAFQRNARGPGGLAQVVSSAVEATAR